MFTLKVTKGTKIKMEKTQPQLLPEEIDRLRGIKGRHREERIAHDKGLNRRLLGSVTITGNLSQRLEAYNINPNDNALVKNNKTTGKN